jgi:hypothetical protein
MADKKGPRAIYQVGTGERRKKLYSYFLQKNGDHFGFKPEDKVPVTKNKKTGSYVAFRGSTSGANAITVPMGARYKTAKGTPKTMQIPMPNEMTIPKIQAFLRKASKNRPTWFVTRDGITYPVGK